MAFSPASWGPGEGLKGQNLISFNLNCKVNFKDFLYETLCVFSQIKDTNQIRRIFTLSPGHVPVQGLWSAGV